MNEGLREQPLALCEGLSSWNMHCFGAAIGDALDQDGSFAKPYACATRAG